MAEPIATSKPEEPAAEAATARERFEHVAPAAVPEAEAAAVEVEAASAPVEEPASASAPAVIEPAASRPEPVATDEKPKAAAPAAHEWPVAWLRLVEPEPQAPQDDAVAAVLAAEAADADGVAHAFGQAMAAALNPEGEDEPEAKAEPEAEPEIVAEAEAAAPHELEAAREPQAANDADPLEPVRLGVARRRVLIEEDAPAAIDETPPPERPSDAPLFNPRLYAPRSPSTPRGDRELQEARSGEGGVAMMVYLLYLAGFLCLPAILGVIIALNARRDAPEWLESHYIFQIRTFWIGLVGVAIAAALLLSGALTLVGLMLGLFLVVWLLGRSALGFVNVVKLRPYPHPLAWLL